MVLLHLFHDAEGRSAFGAEANRPGVEGMYPLTGEVLLDAVRAVVWYPDELEGEASASSSEIDRVVPSLPNLLMFLSDVRERTFKRGVFLAPDVLDAATQFRAVAEDVAEGRFLPDLEERAGGFRAVWRPLRPVPPFARRLLDGFVRRAGWSALERDDERHATVDDAWLAALRSETGVLRWEGADDARDLMQRLSVWRAPLRISPEDRAALSFALVAPLVEDGDWTLTLARPPSTRLGFVALGQAAALCPPLKALTGERLALSRAEAENFLRIGAPTLRAAGYAVTVPDGLVGEHLSAAAELEATTPDEAGAVDAPVAARLTIRVDGEIVTEEDVRFLLDQDSPLVFFRNRWIEVDRNVLREALRAFRSTRGQKLSLREAVGFACGVGRLGRLRVDEVRAHGWLRGLLNELNDAQKFKLLPPPHGLAATLRDYQQRGYSWLAFLTKWGFGPCLADDMGLGKTIQTIAYVLNRKETAGATRPAPVLVVAPVSVTTNWVREFRRFAPGLSVLLHQGSRRGLGHSFRTTCRAADVVVTGYSLLVKDWDDLSHVGFGVLVLDEAQTIKNPDTRVSRAAQGLPAPVKIALTGTPLENSARDLWALEAFLNPGLLGERRAFDEDYARPLREDARTGAAAKLKRLLEPFMLRRLKTDPGIASELGAKREIREYCTLSQTQRRRYEDALAAYRNDVAEGTLTDRARRGRALALLTELKLICDGDGKMARLDELLADIFAAGESCLLFTQYAKIGRTLRDHLLETFGVSFPFLHGGLSPARREAEIRTFNESTEPTAFILSLKAGGFGLNLTRATHVIHFDRWWNPAVENQATDRAHRIGQDKTVFVHLFMCAGTLEDHIDELLETKRLLADEVVGAGEAFLLKMGGTAFEQAVSLDNCISDGGLV